MRLLALIALFGCAGDDEPPTIPSTGSTTTTTPPATCVEPLPEAEVIGLTTRDGVALEADRYAGQDGAPGVALFHMIPPSNTRADYPASFIRKLTCLGWSVVNVDRRGAGGSEGTPKDSYEGPGGALDVLAAVDELESLGAVGIAVVGASNGTTSALDYAVLAQAEGRTVPSAIAFMTGGTYTENNNPMSALPSSVKLGLFYSDLEDSWSEAQHPLDPGSWQFTVYANGGHGTQLFGTDGRKVKQDLTTFLQSGLP